MIADLRTTVKQDIQYPELLESVHSFLIEQDVDIAIRAQIMDSLLSKMACYKTRGY